MFLYLTFKQRHFLSVEMDQGTRKIVFDKKISKSVIDNFINDVHHLLNWEIQRREYSNKQL